jgi:hypothetical protein
MPEQKTKMLKRVSVRVEIAYDPEITNDPRAWNWKAEITKTASNIHPNHINVAAMMEMSDVAVPVEA